jgi:hypothetical protein
LWVVTWPLPALPPDFPMILRSNLLTGINSVRQFKVGIAGVIIEFIAEGNLMLELPEYDHQFITGEGSPDLSLRVHYGPLPELKLEARSSDSDFKMDLYWSGGKYIISASSALYDSIPFRVVTIDADFRHGDLYVRPLPIPETPGSSTVIEDQPSICPTALLGKLLFILLLSRGLGVVIHGCGVIVDGEGLLFTGVSGAGKSTLANLWKKRENATVICDESVVIRRVDGRFWIYGTPWYSSARIASPLGAPLKRVLFIKHSPENCTTPLKASEAATTLLAQSFSDYSEHSGVMYTVGLLSSLAEQVPCHELGFVPDESVLDYICKM